MQKQKGIRDLLEQRCAHPDASAESVITSPCQVHDACMIFSSDLGHQQLDVSHAAFLRQGIEDPPLTRRPVDDVTSFSYFSR